jgi:methyl-accepting chemotaxis protein
MDLIVDKLPRATSQLMAALEAARRVRERNPPLPTDLVDLGTRLGELIGTMANIENTLQNAYRANPDGRLRMAYAAPFQRYREASENYVHGLREWLETTPTMTDMGELIRLHDTAVAEGSIAWKFASTELERLLQSRVDDFKKQIILNLGASVALLALAITLTVLIARSISQPVSKLVKAMNLIAEGELSAEIPGRARRDETGLLANSAAAMRRQLRTLSTEVRGRAAEVQVAAQKIAAAVEEQAATSNETSSSIAEITATMEELTASSTQIAEHSHAVVDIANQTWEGSKKGFEAMQLVMDKMGDIREDNQKSLTEILELGGMSKEISQVMRIITSVADQTKLIAFNAALESASAGDAGRRFGVVAAEIRRLADSVTDSTGEIEAKVNQIQDSINRLVVTSEKGANGITEGLAASITAGSLLNELVDAARQTANAAKQISLSTQQQKTASSQVVAALREIAIASGQTTQSISRIAEISTDMKCLFSELDTRITRFQMIEEESHG